MTELRKGSVVTFTEIDDPDPMTGIVVSDPVVMWDADERKAYTYLVIRSASGVVWTVDTADLWTVESHSVKA